MTGNLIKEPAIALYLLSYVSIFEKTGRRHLHTQIRVKVRASSALVLTFSLGLDTKQIKWCFKGDNLL